MTKELLRGLDISKLSPRSRATLIRIQDPILDGWKETELAAKLGRTPSWVSERLSELRTEILLQNGGFPPLTDAEDASLRESIRRNGVMLPVLVDEDLNLIDGRNRLRLSHDLGVPCPYWILYDLTTEEKREIAVALNAARRQLTRQQKRKLIEHELMHDGTRSDRRIAAICGVSHTTVGAVRHEITESAQRWRELELPLGDAPPWLTAFLTELRDNPDHLGSMTHAARAVGRTYDTVAYWRDRHPTFAAELARVRATVLDAVIDELEHLALRFATHGIEETSDERFTPIPNDDGYRYVTKKTIKWDIKHIQWLLERLYKQRYALDQAGIPAGNIQFVFQLGDRDTDEIEGEAAETDDQPALPPARQDD